MRLTRQKSALLEVFAEADRPLTLEEVFAQAQWKVPSLGLRTVYRNIEWLRSTGQVLAVDYPGQPICYERSTGEERVHIICRQCRKLFYQEEEMPKVSYPASDAFDFNGCDMVLFGDCKRGEGCAYLVKS